MHADKWHRAVVRKLLIEAGKSKENRKPMLKAVESALSALNNFHKWNGKGLLLKTKSDNSRRINFSTVIIVM